MYSIPAEHIERWLPLIVDRLTIEDTLENRALYPDTVPDSFRELLIEQACCIELVRRQHRSAGSTSVLNAHALLTAVATDEIDLLWLALNGYEPIGVTTVYDHKRQPIGVTLSIGDINRPLSVTVDQDTTEHLTIQIAPNTLFLLPPQLLGVSRVLTAHHEVLEQGLSVPAELPLVIDTRPRPLTFDSIPAGSRSMISLWRRSLGLPVRERLR